MTLGWRRLGAAAALLVVLGAAFAAGWLARGGERPQATALSSDSDLFDRLAAAERGTPTWTVRASPLSSHVYRVEDRWETAGRVLPCSVQENPLTGWERECYAGPDLRLYFGRDSALTSMVYELPLPRQVAEQTDPRQVWLDVRDAVWRIVGDPDSVTGIAYEDMISSRLYAFWRPRDDGRCAKLEVAGRPYDGGRAQVWLTLSRFQGQCVRWF